MDASETVYSVIAGKIISSKNIHNSSRYWCKDNGVSKPVDQVHYQSMVGSLLYAAITMRPDIAQAVGAVSKFNSCPTETHLTAVK